MSSRTSVPRSDIMDSRRHLSPLQFGEGDELDGPLGSFGEPAGINLYNFQGVGDAWARPGVGNGDL